MRGKYNCLTCVTAMLLGIEYDEVEKAFGGNLDPTKDRKEESARLRSGLRMLLMKYHRGFIEFDEMPANDRRTHSGSKSKFTTPAIRCPRP